MLHGSATTVPTVGRCRVCLCTLRLREEFQRSIAGMFCGLCCVLYCKKSKVATHNLHLYHINSFWRLQVICRRPRIIVIFSQGCQAVSLNLAAIYPTPGILITEPQCGSQTGEDVTALHLSFLISTLWSRSRSAGSDTVMRCSSGNQFPDLRIHISMSTSGCGGWQELLERKQKDFGELARAQHFSSRSDFIRAVETAADKRKEDNIQMHMIRLRRSYRKVRDFATTVGSQSRQVEPDDLLRLVWEVSFAAITVGSLGPWPD